MAKGNCQAVQRADQMQCDRCALVWDTNDPDPPSCRLDAPTVRTHPDTGLLMPLVIEHAGIHSAEFRALMNLYNAVMK